MSETTVPPTPPSPPRRPNERLNRIGLPLKDYQGSASTLCKGCGHDNITRHITSAYFEMGVQPHDVVKTSGIGCSSKTPAYFIHRGYGINSVHGRMPSVATGAKLANGRLHIIGVSGDGDTASIGLGQFCHLIRRNLDMVYVVENNGVYGLTKGQFSATADPGSVLKSGEVNKQDTIDICATAVTMGGTFVARGFSNDAKQMTTLIKAAISHRGTALLDVISPCVTFNNHPGSTKSIAYVREHDVHLNEVGYVPAWEQPPVDLKPGEAVDVPLPDGSHLVLRHVSAAHDPYDKGQALKVLEEAQSRREILTGVIYVARDHQDFHQELSLSESAPLSGLQEADLRPPRSEFDAYLAEFC